MHRRARVLVCASGYALALTLTVPGEAQNAPASDAKRARLNTGPQTEVKTAPPKGFEDIDSAVKTQFDVVFAGRKIGSFDATYDDGKLTFADPAKVVAALGPDVEAAAVAAFLAQPLPGNEQYRCRPGQRLEIGCGLLPSGTSGVIVNVDTFSISLFLNRQYLVSKTIAPRMLGPATSGPSLIQGVRFSVASNGQGGANYGGTFDTIGSIGQTSFVAQSTISSFTGFRAEQLYAQRVWSDRRAAVGLLQDYQSLIFANYRIAGGEFGSFYGTMVDADNDTATPLEVLLPKRAQVELYRDGVLVATGRYEAGLQLLDTRMLPNGSYNVRIVARDGTQMLVDETRSFSKIGSLVPPGKTGFQIRAGARVRDNFLDGGLSGGSSFLPKTTGELVVSASAQRRLGRALAAGVTVTEFDSRTYGEATLQLFAGRLSGLVAGGIGSDGAYSMLASGTLQFPRVTFYLSAQNTHAKDVNVFDEDRYHAFFRSQKLLFGSAQTQAFGGALSLTGSFARSPGFADRYAVGLRYSRSVRIPFFGSALLSGGVTKSDVDTRIGLTISFFKQIDRKTLGAFTGGAQYLADTTNAGGRPGFSPIADASVSRTERLGPVDLTGVLGASTDADADRVYAQGRALSPYGTADATVQAQSARQSGDNFSYQMNLQTGFVVAGGAVKLGLRNPAESMVMIDLTNLKPRDTADGPATGDGSVPVDGQAENATKVAEGGYRVTIDSKPIDYVRPGQRIAVGLPAYREYVVGLRPEGAPQFDLSGTQQRVTLYPGNVARVRFQAQRVISIFGQILAADGPPLAGARVEAGNDYVVADDRGYFTITAPLTDSVTIRTASGGSCLTRSIASIVDSKSPSILYRFGKLTCAVTTDPVRPVRPVPAPPASAPAPVDGVVPRPVSSSSFDTAPPPWTPRPLESAGLPPGRTVQTAASCTAPHPCKEATASQANLAELQRLRAASQEVLKLNAALAGNDTKAPAAPVSPLAVLVARQFLTSVSLLQ